MFVNYKAFAPHSETRYLHNPICIYISCIYRSDSRADGGWTAGGRWTAKGQWRDGGWRTVCVNEYKSDKNFQKGWAKTSASPIPFGAGYGIVQVRGWFCV